MKNYKIIYIAILVVTFGFYGCQDEDDFTFGDIVVPTNIQITADIVGQDATNPNGDGSGVVHFSASADNALSYKFAYNGNEITSTAGRATFNFSTLGLNTYNVVVIAIGTGGVSSSSSIQVEVLATYAPPPDLLDKLHGTTSKTWRIKNEVGNHFGLGPPGGDIPCEWYGAGVDEKATVGMYDDRYIFHADGTFEHITDSTNDGGGLDPTGTVFGRDPLINELGSSGGTVNGADIENLPFDDYSEQWQLTAPGGVETLSLTGLGFIGYYIGEHSYQIFDRSKTNEITLRIVDANGEFAWWLVLTSD